MIDFPLVVCEGRRKIHANPSRGVEFLWLTVSHRSKLYISDTQTDILDTELICQSYEADVAVCDISVVVHRLIDEREFDH
jgi:hypothetical protein